MIAKNIESHINAYIANGQILDAANFLLHSFGLENDFLEGFCFRDDEKPNYVVVTTEGEFGGLQTIRIPRNLFAFDLTLVVNLLAHEMLHVRQKTEIPFVEDKNEREFQAYYEMLFHKQFPQIPDAPYFNQKQFAEKALEYYNRMEENGSLQQKYAEQKREVLEKLDEILIKRGEKNA